MSRLIFATFGIFCLMLSSTSFADTSGIYFEYISPPAKSDKDLFVAILEPLVSRNATVAQFMYHLKHTAYASAFLTEIFTLAIGTHLFTNDVMENPSDEERRIAYVAKKLWTSLTGMRTINRLALRVSNDTALQYLENEDRIDTIKYLFYQLQDAILSDSALSETYIEEIKSVDDFFLPSLDYVKINLTKFLSIDDKLMKKVWNESKSFPLIAHARFSQHLETKVQDANPQDYENVLTAHLLEEAASIPDLTEEAQRVYQQAIQDVVQTKSAYLQHKMYDQFDKELFKMIALARTAYSRVDEKMMELKNNYPSAPMSEI